MITAISKIEGLPPVLQITRVNLEARHGNRNCTEPTDAPTDNCGPALINLHHPYQNTVSTAYPCLHRSALAAAHPSLHRTTRKKSTCQQTSSRATPSLLARTFNKCNCKEQLGDRCWPCSDSPIARAATKQHILHFSLRRTPRQSTPDRHPRHQPIPQSHTQHIHAAGCPHGNTPG